MPGKCSLSLAIAIMMLVSGILTIAQSKDVRLDSSDEPKTVYGYQHNWDATWDRLVLYRDVTSVSEPGLRWIKGDGQTALVYPLKDFPEAQTMDIWAAVPAPNDSVVASVVISYGPKKAHPPSPIKSLLLTYDASGTLIKVWDVAPRHHFYLTVDQGGNIFAFGISDSSAPDYPLAIKYAPDASVISEFLPANTFKYGDSLIASPSPNGINQIILQSDSILFLGVR